MNILKYLAKRQLITVFLIWVTAIVALGQPTTIRLSDELTKEPIVNATYIYGYNSGNSNESGDIKLDLQAGLSLSISHVQYGEQSFSFEKIDIASKSGHLLLTTKSHLLQPVTSIQIHPNAGEREIMTFQTEEKLAHDAGQLLEKFPSISSIRKSGAYGFDPVLRGFKYEQLNLVIDGVQGATAGCPNRMDPASSQVPLNMISQVEVLKGPYSLRYGNAFGGTINFKSVDQVFSEQAQVLGRISSSYETNGDVSRTEGLIGFSSHFADLKFFGSYSNGNDYTDGEGLVIPARFMRSNFGGKLGLKLSEMQSVNLMVSNNFAEDVDFPALAMDLRKDNTWLFNLGHSWHFRKGKLSSWHTNLYTTFVDHLMDNLDKEIIPRMVDANTAATTYNVGGRTELRFDFDTGWIYAGSDMRIENADGERERFMLIGGMAGQTLVDNVWQDAQIRNNGMFAEYHFQGGNFHFVGSGRLDLNHSEARDPDVGFESLYESLNSDIVTGAVSFGGTKMFNDYSSLGLWMGTSERSPGLAERYINFLPIGIDPYEMIGNPDLKPERNNQIDLVFSHTSEKTDLNVNLFASFLRNYISSEIRNDLDPRMASAPGVRQFLNIEKALQAGFELSWKQLLFPRMQQSLELAYTYGENQETNEALPEIPPMEFRYGLHGTFFQNKLKTEISFRHAFKQSHIASSFGETKTPSFDVVNLSVSYAIGKNIMLNSGVQNLFDEAYYEHLSRSVRTMGLRPIYSPGRSFYFSFEINFM